MSVLGALDATRICTRWSKPLDDPAAWMVPLPVIARRESVPRGYSWWWLARNPHAMLVTGMVGTVMGTDAVLHILAPAGVRTAGVTSESWISAI